MAFLPDEWQDDNRMNFMFSAFPENRNVNPKHWESKLQFWKSAITRSCDYFDKFDFDIDVLKARFNRDGLTPLGICTVLNEMLNSGEIVRKNDFLESVYDTWSAWSLGIAKKSLWWTFGKVWQTNEIDIGSFLLLHQVEKKAERILSYHYQYVKHSTTDNIIPENVLKSRLKAGNLELSEHEFEVVICQLRKEKKLSVHVLENGEKIFKFSDKNQGRASTVTENDLNILKLRKAEATTKLQITKLNKETDELQSLIVSANNDRLKSKVKKLLIRKHAMIKILDKKESLLMNIQDILRHIQEAHSDVSVIDALKAGAQVFKTLSQEYGLTIDNVEKIMGDVEDVMDETAEINKTISEGSKTIAASSGVDVEDLELEEELKNLILHDKESSKDNISGKEKLISQLPDVPNFSPQKQPETKERILLTS
ncbi:charged multivesicular body protein 7-like isoform X2 [Xenia sp. Carnegie-2017]|nr:charged multivesicular body protein 7-like isoform X2 [Xenia sp. Carnegie-2017]